MPRTLALALIVPLLLAVGLASAPALDRGPPAQRTGPLAVTGEGSSGPISGMCVTVAGQSVCRRLSDWWNDRANVIAYGADPTGATDSTLAIRRALATGKALSVPGGSAFRVRGNLVLNAGQRILCDGVTTSRFYVDALFDLSAPAVLTAVGDAAGIDGCGIEFEQPASGTTRATVIHYPPALDISQATRFRTGVLRISAAWDGIRCAGNCGGFDGGLLEIGALNRGILIDGALDFVHVASLHCYGFGIAGNPALEPIYYDLTTTCAEFGRVDGLDIKTLDTFTAAVLGNANGNVGAARQIGMLQLDGDGARFKNAGGDVHIGLLSSTKGLVADPSPAIENTGSGTVVIASLRTFGGSTASFVRNGAGTLVIGGGHLQQVADRPAIEVVGGTVMVQGVALAPSQSATRTQPYLLAGAGGCLVAKGNIATTTGAGNLVFVTADAACQTVQGNDFNGWGYALPSGAHLGEYGPNKVAPFTWTPTPGFDGGNGSFSVASYPVRQGFYSYGAGKIDYWFRVYFAHGAFSGASGNFTIAGLPFNAAGMDLMPGALGEFGGFALSGGYVSAAPVVRGTGGGQGVYLQQQGGPSTILLPASGVPASAGSRYVSGAGSIPLR